MKKTLGGDRLGSGKKMTVDLHGYDRSTHDKSYITRTTMSAGTLVPFINEIALNGDTFDIDLDVDVKTHPTIGPLFGSYKVQVDIFKCPIRLYQGRLHNNELGIGLKMEEIMLPVMQLDALQLDATTFTGNLSTAQINPSSILAHLGLMGIGQRNPIAANGVRTFNALSLLAYWDAYKNYYANKQEDVGVVVHTVPTAKVEHVDHIENADGDTIPQNTAGAGIFPIYNGQMINVYLTLPGQPLDQVLMEVSTMPGTTGIMVPLSELGTVVFQSTGQIQLRYEYTGVGATRYLRMWRYVEGQDIVKKAIELHRFDLGDIDEMRQAILAYPYTNPTTAFEVTGQGLEPYNLFNVTVGGFKSIMESQEGLGVKTYQSDMFNNWMNSTTIDDINQRTRVSTASGSFSMESLILARKVYDLLNRIEVSGGSYDDWQDAVWGMERYSRSEIPVYVGGLSKELVFQEVVSNSEAGTGEGSQPLGTLAGKGVMAGKHKGGKVTIKVDEPSVILGLISLTPRIDYSQGNDWTFGLESMDDLHKPELDEIGWQDFIAEKAAWWTTEQHPDGHWIQKRVGKQPAWLDYMTNVNRVRGNFAIEENEMFMTLNRRYEWAASGTWFTIEDMTSYIDPEKYNQIFAQTSLDSQNFWVQIGVEMYVRRVMSAKLMPNL